MTFQADHLVDVSPAELATAAWLAASLPKVHADRDGGCIGLMLSPARPQAAAGVKMLVIAIFCKFLPKELIIMYTL